MFLGLLNPDPTSDLLLPLRFFKFPNLKVQNTPFSAILGVILYTVLYSFFSLYMRPPVLKIVALPLSTNCTHSPRVITLSDRLPTFLFSFFSPSSANSYSVVPLLSAFLLLRDLRLFTTCRYIHAFF